MSNTYFAVHEKNTLRLKTLSDAIHLIYVNYRRLAGMISIYFFYEYLFDVVLLGAPARKRRPAVSTHVYSAAVRSLLTSLIHLQIAGIDTWT